MADLRSRVSFGGEDEVGVAGSQGGSLKHFDLAEAKVVRTLTGCTCLGFHPYGELLTAASLARHEPQGVGHPAEAASRCS